MQADTGSVNHSVFMVEILWPCVILPSQLSCLGSSVGNGFESYPNQAGSCAVFLEILGQLHGTLVYPLDQR